MLTKFDFQDLINEALSHDHELLQKEYLVRKLVKRKIEDTFEFADFLNEAIVNGDHKLEKFRFIDGEARKRYRSQKSS